MADSSRRRHRSVRAALAERILPDRGSPADLRIGAPIARPSAVICIGMNYAAHAAESGSAPPEIPIMFLKTPNTVVGPNDIGRDSAQQRQDRLGGRARHRDRQAGVLPRLAGRQPADTSPASSRRTTCPSATFQMEVSGGQWSKGKCAPGLQPDRPVARDPRRGRPPATCGCASWVNGEPRQDSSTADLIFDVDFIVWHLSQYLALEPGDLVLTGTPEGVALSGRFPYLKAGDVCRDRDRRTRAPAPGVRRRTYAFTGKEQRMSEPHPTHGSGNAGVRRTRRDRHRRRIRHRGGHRRATAWRGRAGRGPRPQPRRRR